MRLSVLSVALKSAVGTTIHYTIGRILSVEAQGIVRPLLLILEKLDATAALCIFQKSNFTVEMIIQRYPILPLLRRQNVILD